MFKKFFSDFLYFFKGLTTYVPLKLKRNSTNSKKLYSSQFLANATSSANYFFYVYTHKYFPMDPISNDMVVCVLSNTFSTIFIF